MASPFLGLTGRGQLQLAALKRHIRQVAQLMTERRCQPTLFILLTVKARFLHFSYDMILAETFYFVLLIYKAAFH